MAQESATIKETYASKFQSADNISGVIEYAKKTLGIELIGYSKVNVDAGNMINREIGKLFDIFGNLAIWAVMQGKQPGRLLKYY